MPEKRDIRKISPLLKNGFTGKPKIHPALDFYEDEFFYSVWLDSNVEYVEGDNEIKKCLWFVSNDQLKMKEDLQERFDFKTEIAGNTPIFNTPSNKLLNFVNKGNLKVCSYVDDVYLFYQNNNNKKCDIHNYRPKESFGENHLHDLHNYIVYTNELFQDINGVLNDFIDFSDKYTSELLSVWIMGTYMFPIFHSFPYISVGGVKNSGKTKLMEVCRLLSFNGLMSSSASASSIFRIINSYRPSLFIDESESLSNAKNKPELMSVLNNGYKNGAFALRAKQKGNRTDFEVGTFDLYCPKMIAAIRGLDRVLYSRTIPIVMRRTGKKQGNRELNDKAEIWQQIRDGLFLFSWQAFADVRELYNNFENKTNLLNRDWELWKPILTISKIISEDIYNNLVEYAEKVCNTRKEDESQEDSDLILLETIISLLNGETTELTTSDIIFAHKQKFDDGENKDKYKWMNPRWLGNSYRRLGFKTDKAHKMRKTSGMVYIFHKKEVLELAKNMGVEVKEAEKQETIEVLEVNENEKKS